MRRFDDPPLRDRTYHLRPGVYGILYRHGQLLLTHQSEPEPEVQLPGGGIDPGESPLQALHREVIEETGWRISVHHRLGAYQRFTYMPEYDLWAQKICHIYLCRPARQLCEPTEAGHRVLWRDVPGALRDLTNAGDREFLRREFC